MWLLEWASKINMLQVFIMFKCMYEKQAYGSHCMVYSHHIAWHKLTQIVVIRSTSYTFTNHGIIIHLSTRLSNNKLLHCWQLLSEHYCLQILHCSGDHWAIIHFLPGYNKRRTYSKRTENSMATCTGQLWHLTASAQFLPSSLWLQELYLIQSLRRSVSYI